MIRVRLGLVMAAALAASACGYHLGGKADLIPKNIHTIAIPAFGNGTVRYDLARSLPADITNEFHSRTHYVIVTDVASADAVLRGNVTNISTIPATTDPATGRATGVQVVVNLQITLTDQHTGKVIYTNNAAEFRERYEVAIDPKAYFDESSTALRRVSQDVARDVVSGILSAF